MHLEDGPKFYDTLALAVYAALRSTWIASLEKFALLRTDKAAGEDDGLPLLSAAYKKDENVLEKAVGFIGDMDDENHSGVI